MEKNRLYFGDCLEVIQKDSDDESMWPILLINDNLVTLPAGIEPGNKGLLAPGP